MISLELWVFPTLLHLLDSRGLFASCSFQLNWHLLGLWDSCLPWYLQLRWAYCCSHCHLCLDFVFFSKGSLPPTFLILMSCSLLYLSVLALNLRTSGEEIMMFGFFRQKLPRIYDSVFNSFLGYCTFEQIAVGFSVAKGLPVRNLQETTTITARKSLWFPQHFEMCKLWSKQKLCVSCDNLKLLPPC